MTEGKIVVHISLARAVCGLIAVAGLAIGAVRAQQTMPYSSIPFAFTPKLAATSIIVIEGGDGRKAIIDFSGSEVIYGGDLPVSESARMFFRYVMHEMRAPCEEKKP